MGMSEYAAEQEEIENLSGYDDFEAWHDDQQRREETEAKAIQQLENIENE